MPDSTATDAMSTAATLFDNTDPHAARAHLELPAQPASPSVATAFTPCLQQFMAATPGLRAAIVADSHGLALCSVPHLAPPHQPLAGVAGTVLVVSRAMLEQAAMGDCKHLVIESGEGAIVVMPVGDSPHELLLAAFADSSAMLGQVLWAARRCCTQLRAAAASAGSPSRGPGRIWVGP